MSPGTCSQKLRKLSTSNFEETPSTEQEGATYVTLPTFDEGRGEPGGQERLTGHPSTADTTSSMAVLPEETKLLVV